MTLSSTAHAASVAFRALIDYAGLFPPARLEMVPAVDEYAQLRSTPDAWMLGRFILPQTSLSALEDALRDRSVEPFALSLIVGSGADGRTFVDVVSSGLDVGARLERARVECIEVPLPTLAAARETYDAAIGQLAAALSHREMRALPTFVELPRDARFEGELERAATSLRRARMGAKLRCGGVTADAFPNSATVATFIETMCDAGVPFKCTAGLHHPVRHVDPASGFHMHGFLNILVAAALAGDVSRDELVGVLDDEDASHFRFEQDALHYRHRSIDAATLERTRSERFIAYGSCSFTEPTDDLRAMEVLA